MLQYSCLENSMDGGVWWATVHGVAKSQTQLITHTGNSFWLEKARDFQKSIYFCFIDYAKTFDCESQQTGKFIKRWEYQTTIPGSWETSIQVKKQQLKLDMEQQTGSKSGKEYVKAVYCHSAYLTCMQSTSCKMLGWMKHKLESRLLGEISITRLHLTAFPTPPSPAYGIKQRGIKEPLDESEKNLP